MTFKSFISWLLDHWKAISAIIASILALIAGATVVSSCGSSVKAMVTTPKDSSVTHISITTSNPTEITPSTSTNPNIELK